jgi:membrane dipeptidase
MAQSSKSKPAKSSPNPHAVHAAALVIDTHADTPQRFLDENFDIGSDAGEGEIDLAKIARGNLGAEFFSIWVEPRYKGQYARRAFRLIDSVYRQAQLHPDKIMMAFSPADIEAAHRQHKFAALMGIEGGHAIENDLGLLRDFARLGVRYMTLTWSNTNEWADSSGDISDANVQHHNGLTPFGRDVVLEMNRLGMMVDISHVADKTFWDTIATTKAPVIASHSSARALTNAPRNMTDEMLKAVAKNGGVVMVNFYNGFIDDDYRKANAAQSRARDAAVEQAVADWQKAHPGKEVPYSVSEHVSREWAKKIPRPPLSALIDHIDHIAKVAGVDHVGLGSDFDGVSGGLPQGMDSVADLPKITEALMARGYSAADVRKILGENLMRVFRDVERVAAQLRGGEPEWHPAESAGAAPKAKGVAAGKR